MIMATSSRGEKPHTVQPQSAACESTLAPGSTVAQHHLRLLLPRDNPPFRPRSGCFGDPTKEKEQLRNSSLSDRSRENSRRPQGMRRTPPVSAHVCRCNIGARAALTRSTGLTSRANGLRAARVCAARAASVFTALAPALCAHQAGALPRKFRRSSHSTAVTARKLQLHSHAEHAGPSTFNASPNRASEYSPLCPRSLRR